MRLIAALGGKRENGAVKEKNAPSDDFLGDDDDDVTTGFGWRIELMDRQRRKRDAAKKRTRMAIRGGRIVGLSRNQMANWFG